MRASRNHGLDEELALSVQSVSKAESGIHEARYRPVVSVFTHLRERRSGAGGSIEPELVDVIDEDEEDDDVEELSAPRETGASLDAVSFDVRRGEAVGVAGSAEVSRTVARVLSGMTAPTAGRILVRGRVAPSIELATLLSQRETTVRGVARRLAALAGPGKRRHTQFVSAALELALGADQSGADLARPSKNVLRRVAAAAAFDPTAEVLVIDALPELGDPGFAGRCRDRLAERLASGAAVVITAPDPALIADFCSHVVWLREGRVERIVSGAAVEEAPQPAPSELVEEAPQPRSRVKPELATADEHAELRAFALLRPGGAPMEDARGDDWITAQIDFAIATTALVKLVVRFGAGDELTFIQRGELDVGTYRATLRIPPGAVPAGDYDIAVGLILEHHGARTKVGRNDVARLRVDDDEGLVAAAEAGAAPAPAADYGPSEAEWSLETV